VDGSLTAQVSTLEANIRTGGIARISGCAGTINSEKGSDVEIDASTLSGASFRGALVLTNSTLTGQQGSLREGFLQVESTSIDVVTDFGVGSRPGSTATTADTDVIWTKHRGRVGRRLDRGQQRLHHRLRDAKRIAVAQLRPLRGREPA
jgi:hypothetical protein